MFRQSQLVILHSAWLNFGICDMIIHPLMKSQRWVHDHPDSSCPDPMWGCLPKDFHPIPITRPTFSRCSQFKNTQKTMWGQYTTLRSTRNTEETQRGFFFPILISSYQKPPVAFEKKYTISAREHSGDVSEHGQFLQKASGKTW